MSDKNKPVENQAIYRLVTKRQTNGFFFISKYEKITHYYIYENSVNIFIRKLSNT
jgi:hypothetical protein